MQARATTIQIDIDTEQPRHQRPELGSGVRSHRWQSAAQFGDDLELRHHRRRAHRSPDFPMVTGTSPATCPLPPGIVTLNDSSPVTSFFNEYLDNANHRIVDHVRPEYHGNKDSGFDPDTFSFFFLDPATGVAASDVGSHGRRRALRVQHRQRQSAGVVLPPDTNCVRAAPVVAAAPEPGALALASRVSLLCGGRARVRKVPCVSMQSPSSAAPGAYSLMRTLSIDVMHGCRECVDAALHACVRCVDAKMLRVRRCRAVDFGLTVGNYPPRASKRPGGTNE